MITSKERSILRGYASNITPIAQVGKNGINDNMIKSLSDALDARELIKINVLENSDDDAKNFGQELATSLKAECVAVIGRKIILYRKSRRKDVKHIEIV